MSENVSYLSESDARAIIRLLGEVAMVTGDVFAKRTRVLEGLCEIVGADVWVWMDGKTNDPAIPSLFYSYIDGGWASPAEREIYLAAGVDPQTAPTMQQPIFMALERGNHSTLTASDVYGPRRILDTLCHERYMRKLSLTDSIVSIYPLGEGKFSAIALMGGRPGVEFGSRERMIVHLVTSEIPWLHRLPDADADQKAEQVASLSPRQRQVLILLLTGNGRKQIAHKLGISENTVHSYIKALHQHFDVQSRGELLSKFLTGGLRGDAAAAEQTFAEE